MVDTAYSREKMVKLANLFAEYTRKKIRFETSSEVTVENAGISIVRSCLYCINVMDSGIFEIHKIELETKNLYREINRYKFLIHERFVPLQKALDDALQQIEYILKVRDDLTLEKPVSKPKNMRSRYIAAIVANCYFDSFNRWPVTPKGYPKRDYLRCTEQVCAVSDKRNLYGISAACKEFVVDPWELWEETPPFPVGKL